MRNYEHQLLQLIMQGEMEGRRSYSGRIYWLKNLRQWYNKNTRSLFRAADTRVKIVLNDHQSPLGDGISKKKQKTLSEHRIPESLSAALVLSRLLDTHPYARECKKQRPVLSLPPPALWTGPTIRPEVSLVLFAQHQ